jgi:hypothetical protein
MPDRPDLSLDVEPRGWKPSGRQLALLADFLLQLVRTRCPNDDHAGGPDNKTERNSSVKS